MKHEKSIPKLNLDVLDVVFSYIPAEHALRFSTVSSSIYEIALRRALTSVRLKDFRKTLRFCAFILSYGATRISLLRGLEILEGAFIVRKTFRQLYNELGTDADEAVEEEEGEYDFSLATILASVLGRAHGLLHLHISGAESILHGSPLLGDAISGLHSLRKLELENIGSRGQAFLRRMQSNVRELSLQFGTCALEDLSRFQDLERVRLFRMRVFSSSGGGCPSEGRSSTFEWPKVHTLRAGYVTASLAAFTSAFPNVRMLDASEVAEPTDAAGVCEASPSWRKLDHLVVCTGHRQRRWQVSGTARRLSIVNSISSLPSHVMSSLSNNQEEALEVVRDTSPSCLSLSVSCEVDGQFWTRLAETGGHLRHMEIKLLAARGVPALIAWMIDVLPHMKKLPLVTLSVSLQRSPFDETAALPLPGEPMFQELGVAIASTISSLRCLSLRSSQRSRLPRHPFNRIHEHAWWIIRRDDRQAVLKLFPFLPDAEARQLKDVDVETIDGCPELSDE